MKRSMMERRGIRQVLARKLALRFTHNVFKPGHGEIHLKSIDSTAEFETDDSVKGMVYWCGKTIVVSFALPDGLREMYELTADEIVEAAIRWRKKRAAVMSQTPTVDSLPLLPETDEDSAHGNLGEPGAFQGPLPPPELPQGAE